MLYFGPSSTGADGFTGGGRTNYAYLPGQTLAPEEIYFDQLTEPLYLIDSYLNHFDAVVQARPDSDVDAAHQKRLESFARDGHGLINYTDGKRPTDAVLREAVLAAVNRKARAEWQASLASRPPLKRLDGEVPNYEHRPEPVKFQAPLDPKDSLRYTQVPADFELQLFASEPDVVKPIFVGWDERGRAWVIEARDYPHGLVAEGEPGHDDIKICEDTDGDGRADKFTVFADQFL